MRKIKKQKLLSSSSEDEMPSRLHSPPIRNLTPKATNVLDVANHSEGVHHQNPSNILRVSEIPNDDGNFSQGKVPKANISITINIGRMVTEYYKSNISKVNFNAVYTYTIEPFLLNCILSCSILF